jgi:hypothetical protein
LDKIVSQGCGIKKHEMSNGEGFSESLCNMTKIETLDQGVGLDGAE